MGRRQVFKGNNKDGKKEREREMESNVLELFLSLPPLSSKGNGEGREGIGAKASRRKCMYEIPLGLESAKEKVKQKKYE